jgi:hypothetical protein
MINKVEKQVYIDGQIHLLKTDEILAYITEEALEAIRAIDPHPIFTSMIIGYEGESKGDLYIPDASGSLGKIKRWFKQVWPLSSVNKLVNHLKEHEADIHLYSTHDISAPIRNSLGKAITGVKKVIDGVTHAIAICYVSDFTAKQALMSGKINSCSLEATCLFSHSDEIPNKYVVKDVRNLNAIALCNSEEHNTGFENSKILSVIAALEADDVNQNNNLKGKKVTKEEIKQYIEENSVKPTDLFSSHTLLSIPIITDAIENEKKVIKSDYEEKNKELNDKVIAYEKQQQQATLKDKIATSDLLKNEYKEAVDYLKEVINVDISNVEDTKVQEVVDNAIKNQLNLMQKHNFKVKFGSEESSKDTNKDKDSADSIDGKNEDKDNIDDSIDSIYLPKAALNPKENPLIV